jgi:hypothetical protein
LLGIKCNICGEMSIKIEKGKPIPDHSKQGKYPWSTIEIGDSFIADSRHVAFGSLANYNKKMKLRKQKQIRIETRKEGDKCRVWRIK